jgi:hypothetical protein
MAIVSESVRVFAQGYVIPSPRAVVVARRMREEDSTLLPRDPVGRNLGTHLLPPHIVNLMLGLAIGDPIARVAQQVKAYRLAGYHTPLNVVLNEAAHSLPILGRQSLGLDLDGLVDCLARPSDKAQEIRHKWSGSFLVTLFVGDPMPVRVENIVTNQLDLYYPTRSAGQGELTGDETFQFQKVKYPVTPLYRTVHLRLAHFEIAAALWADSLKHGAVYKPSLLDPSGIEPENKTAASGPGRDQNAAAVSDQTADTELDGSPQNYLNIREREAQLSRVERPGRHFHPSGTTHDRTEPYPASASLG